MVFSQSKPKEIGIVIDNDLFTSTVNDQYYTNGIEIFYKYLSQNENPNINKKITEFKFGQYIYNPHTVEAASIRKHDRPFAGYLFAEAGIHKFYQNHLLGVPHLLAMKFRLRNQKTKLHN